MANKSNYSKSMPLPGIIHGGENAPLKGKNSPFKMVGAAGSTDMKTVNKPMAVDASTVPLMKGEAALMGTVTGINPSITAVERHFNPGKYRGGQAGKAVHKVKKK